MIIFIFLSDWEYSENDSFMLLKLSYQVLTRTQIFKISNLVDNILAANFGYKHAI